MSGRMEAKRELNQPESAPTSLSMAQLGADYRERRLRVEDVVGAYLKRIECLDSRLNAFLLVDAERALDCARELDTELDRGHSRGPLHGVPVAVKDVFNLKGLATTAGSKWSRRTRRDAWALSRLRDQGVVFLGKTNMDEWAYGVTNHNVHFGSTHNPWHLSHVTGGSSGGSASAVAASLSLAATGSDTGGSVRIPAAHCGVVGFKPTYGRISVDGMAPLSPSLDHAGVLARSVADANLLLWGMAGLNPGDPTSRPYKSLPLLRAVIPNLDGWKVLIDADFSMSDVHEDVAIVLEKVVEAFRGSRARVEEATITGLVGGAEAAMTVIQAEASFVHRNRMRRSPQRFGAEVRTKLERGLSVTGVQVAEALQRRQQLRWQFRRVIDHATLLLTPTCPIPATRLDDDPRSVSGLHPSGSRSFSRFTRPFNLLGLPAISVPAGWSRDGLPIGVQLIAGPWQEARLLIAAAVLERELAFRLPRLEKGPEFSGDSQTRLRPGGGRRSGNGSPQEVLR